MQSWLVSMETNQPSHLVTLTHSTRSIAEGMRKQRERERERVENSDEEVKRTRGKLTNAKSENFADDENEESCTKRR